MFSILVHHCSSSEHTNLLGRELGSKLTGRHLSHEVYPFSYRNPTPDLGRKLENAVLLSLRRRGASPAFAAAPHEWECDFVTEDLAIQCCARLTPENRERELRGLSQAADLPGRAGSRDLVIVTLDQQDSLTEDGRRIRVIPAWKWLD